MARDINPELNVLETGEEEKVFDLKAFLGKLLGSWWIFLVSLAVCGILAALFLYYKAPAYNIVSSLLVDDSNNASSALSGSSIGSSLDLSDLLGLKSNVNNEAYILQTRSLLAKTVSDMDQNIIYYQRRLITDLKINRNPFTVKILKPVDTIQTTKFKVYYVDNKKVELKYSVTYPDLSTGSTLDTIVRYDKPFFVTGVGIINISLNPAYSFGTSNYRFDVESVDNRVYDLTQILTISVPSTTVSTISIVFDYPIPREGEDILNTLIANYKSQNVRFKNEVADSTISFINSRLVAVNDDLNNVEQKIQNFKQKNKLLGDVTDQSKLLLGNSSNYNDEVVKNETQINIVSSLIDYLNDENKNKTVVPISVLPTDLVFTALVTQYNSLLLERDKELLSATPDNPFMQNMNERIALLRKDMLKNLVETKKSLVITDENLKKSSNGFQNQISEAPPIERVYLDLSRNMDIQQTLYTFLLKEREETEITKTSNLSIATIIDPPKSDYKPYSPSIPLTIAFAAFLAIAFPIGRIFIKDILNSKILLRDDIAKNTVVPIIGEISHNKSQNHLVLSNTGRSAIAEQFRSLRTNLQFFINKNEEKVILVTSSMSGEGKSFVTVNLASILAISDKKVLVMELDLRKPKISSYFGIENNNGFSNYIVSKDMELSSIITNSVFYKNLYIISSGPIPPNPTELILDERTDEMMEELKKEFDYIIIDAPPVGLVTDAQLLNRFSDMTLYIVRQNFTLKEQLRIPQDLYRKGKMKKISIVVNDIAVKNNYGYGYSYGYGYGYGYGYYQEDENKKDNFIKRGWKRISKRSKSER